MKKTLALCAIAAVLLLLISVPAIYGKGPPPASSKVKDSNKVTFELRELTRTVSISGSGSPTLNDFWPYITNPSDDMTRATLSSVDIFGNQGNFAVPAAELLINQVVFADAGPAGTTTFTCNPPQAATSAGQFPTQGTCTGAQFTEYRFAFRGWGQTAVAPAETTLVWFVGESGFTSADIGAHTVTISISYTFQSVTATISTSIAFTVVA